MVAIVENSGNDFAVELAEKDQLLRKQEENIANLRKRIRLLEKALFGPDLNGSLTYRKISNSSIISLSRFNPFLMLFLSMDPALISKFLRKKRRPCVNVVI